MQIPVERLLNLPDVQALNVEITERETKCGIKFEHLRQIRSYEISMLKERGDFVAVVSLCVMCAVALSGSLGSAGVNRRSVLAR